MKHLLLIIFLLGVVPLASAQYGLAAYGVAAGIGMLKGQPQKANEFVTHQSYRSRQFQQKRTPSDKLPKKGSVEIATLESFLTNRYTTLLANDTSAVLGTEEEATYTTAQSRVEAARPFWNLAAYSAEMDFYRREDSRRSQARDLAYRQRQSLQSIRLRRIEHQKDSAFRAALLRIRDAEMQQRQAASQAFVKVDAPATVAVAHITAATTANIAHRSPNTVVHKPAVKRAKVVVKARRSTGPKAYYCASGNTVKYHTSPNCRGLNACRASVQPMSLSEARQLMDPCTWCN